jgi:hypothetical protein
MFLFAGALLRCPPESFVSWGPWLNGTILLGALIKCNQKKRLFVKSDMPVRVHVLGCPCPAEASAPKRLPDSLLAAGQGPHPRP